MSEFDERLPGPKPAHPRRFSGAVTISPDLNFLGPRNSFDDVPLVPIATRLIYGARGMGAELNALLVCTSLLTAAPGDVPVANTSSVQALGDLDAVVERALGGNAVRVTDHHRLHSQEESRSRGDRILAAIGSSPKACSLRHLYLSYVRVTAHGIAALAAPCLSLETLDVSFTEMDDSAAISLSSRPFASSLRILWIHSNYLTPLGISAIVDAFVDLEELRVGQNLIGPTGAAALARGSWPRLRVLDLSVNPTWEGFPIGPEGAKTLATAPLPVLEELNLGGHAIGADGVRALIECGLVQKLRKLFLSQNAIDRSTAAALANASPRTVVEFAIGPDATVIGAWSVARALRLEEGNVVPVDVVISTNEDAAALRGIVEIRGSLSIMGDVQTLAPLQSLEVVTGDLILSGTRRLHRVDGLSRLRLVGGDVQFAGNLALGSTSGLSALREVGGSIWIPLVKVGNPGLSDVAFPALERVGGAIKVHKGSGYLVHPVPKGTPPVEIKTIRKFPRLKDLGQRCCIVETEPQLFPALASETTPK